MGCVEVEVKGLRRAGRAPALAQGQNADDADAVALRESQRVAGGDGVAGFGAGLGVQAQVAGCDHGGSEAAGAKEAGVKEPEVEAGGHWQGKSLPPLWCLQSSEVNDFHPFAFQFSAQIEVCRHDNGFFSAKSQNGRVGQSEA